MSGDWTDPSVRWRGFAAGALALMACILAVATFGPGSTGNAAPRVNVEQRIGAALDTLFARENITPANVKSWRATASGKPTGRLAQRVTVGRSFLSLKFNHDLSTMVSLLGVRVVAVEKTKEETVSMHIICGGVTVRSVAFVTETRKE
jgi:hypothetical protein